MRTCSANHKEACECIKSSVTDTCKGGCAWSSTGNATTALFHRGDKPWSQVRRAPSLLPHLQSKERDGSQTRSWVTAQSEQQASKDERNMHKGEIVDGQDETCYNEQFLTSISPLLACLATLLWRHISHEPASGRRAQEAKFFQLQFSLKCVSCGESRSGHVGLWEGQKWTWRRESGSSPLLSNRLTDLCSGIKPGLRGKTHKQPRTAHSNEWTSAEAGWAAAAAARIALQRINGGNFWCYLSES